MLNLKADGTEFRVEVLITSVSHLPLSAKMFLLSCIAHRARCITLERSTFKKSVLTN